MAEKLKVLEKCRVLDLSSELGFLCGKIFGDLGADVIKIEKPGGDPARTLGTFYKDEPQSFKMFKLFKFIRQYVFHLEKKRTCLKMSFSIIDWPHASLCKNLLGWHLPLL